MGGETPVRFTRGAFDHVRPVLGPPQGFHAPETKKKIFIIKISYIFYDFYYDFFFFSLLFFSLFFYYNLLKYISLLCFCFIVYSSIVPIKLYNNNNKKLIKKYKEAFESRASESLIRKGCNAGDKMGFEVLKMLKPISTRVSDALSVKGSKTIQFQSLFYFHLTHFLSISQN